jgi:hypothetical protein
MCRSGLCDVGTPLEQHLNLSEKTREIAWTLYKGEEGGVGMEIHKKYTYFFKISKILKEVGNEKGGMSGGWQMFEDVSDCGYQCLFAFYRCYVLLSSFLQRISVSILPFCNDS